MASQCPTANVPDHLVADWSTLVSIDQDFNFCESRGLSSCNTSFQINRGQNCSVAGSVPSSTFGNESFSEMNKSSDYCETSQFRSPLDLQSNSKHAIEKNFKGKKRKHSPANNIHDFEAEQQTDAASESANISIENYNKQQKNQMNPGVTTQKPTARGTKSCSQEGNAVIDNYIHVRAKRGQATNSHSLAERVRRERISERMRLLQDLVPGCNKITGKAMMLDEIINYVQSLQCQVEFLSMKLSTVNPEYNLDLEQILKKETLHSREGGSHVAFAQGFGSFNPSMPGLSLQGLVGLETHCGISSESDMLRASYLHAPGVAQQLSSMWGDELQNVAQLGYVANASTVLGTEQNGSAKVEPQSI